MTELTLEAKVREELGTGASRRMRHAGFIPAVIYGAEDAPQSITVEHRHVIKALENEAFSSSILTVNVDGKPIKAVVKALQRHPFKPKVLHVDFQRVSAKQKIIMRVPFNFVGGDVCPGVKLQSGIISQNQTDVEITCLPTNLPEAIEVDLSHLEAGQAVHLADVKLPEGVEFTTALTQDNNMPVASVHIPRAAVAADKGDEAGDAADDADKAAE